MYSNLQVDKVSPKGTIAVYTDAVRRKAKQIKVLEWRRSNDDDIPNTVTEEKLRVPLFELFPQT